MSSAENRLIERLPTRDRRRLLRVAEPVLLIAGALLCQREASTRHVYFPVEGFVSLLAAVDAHADLEVGMVGREGMLGAPLALGIVASPWGARVQGAGRAWRVASQPFRRALADSPALQRALQRYLFVLLTQLATSSACLHFHEIEPRLARWLLMTQDRAHDDRFAVTHEVIAGMLGVRRVGITLAAGLLQRRGLIEYHRGRVRVTDRVGLEAAACGCYATDRQRYREQFG